MNAVILSICIIPLIILLIWCAIKLDNFFDMLFTPEHYFKPENATSDKMKFESIFILYTVAFVIIGGIIGYIIA